MDSSEGPYGWAADDPRWTDILAGGKGRLEPSPPPRFGESDLTAEQAPADDHTPAATPAAARPLDLPTWPPAAQPTTTEDARGPLSGSAAPWPPTPSSDGQPADGLTAARAAEPDAVPWIPEDTALAASGARPWTEPALTPWEPTPWQPPTTTASAPWPAPPGSAEDLFGPPRAISAQPAPAAPPLGHGGAATTVPFTIHTQFPTPGLRTGYGLTSAALPVGVGGSASDTALPARSGRISTRLDRQVRVRTRRRADDEFRQAGRAELFSDDARYSVLLWLTAAWYAPIAVVYLGWAVIAGGSQGGTGTGVFAGVLWLAAGAVLSLGVVSLLRWASVGWRAITLSLAAAVIGGGVVTIAHTLAG